MDYTQYIDPEDLNDPMSQIGLAQMEAIQQEQTCNEVFDMIYSYGFGKWWRNVIGPVQSHAKKIEIVDKLIAYFSSIEVEDYEKAAYLKMNIEYCKRHGVKVPMHHV